MIYGNRPEQCRSEKKRNMLIRMTGLFVLLFVLTAAQPALAAKKSAADAETGETVKTEETVQLVRGVNRGWVKRDGCFYYYNKKGKSVTGVKKIRGKYYYFDSNGIQRTGWRRVGKKVYYFQIENGKKGYQLFSQRVNGVRLKKNGAAKVTKAVRDKVDLLLRYQLLADQLEAYPREDKHSKLVRAFKYARDTVYQEVSVPSSGNWDQYGARRFLESRFAECIISACGFAYLANAIGYKDVTVRQYIHGHCEINRRIYDPGFAKTVSDWNYTTYFNRSYSDLPDWGTGDFINTRRI